jgi:hypothetical protein
VGNLARGGALRERSGGPDDFAVDVCQRIHLRGYLGRQMRKFSFRSFMIFVMCLAVAVLLIGLSIAGVIKLKHKDISNNSENELQQPLQMSADLRVLHSRPWRTAPA